MKNPCELFKFDCTKMMAGNRERKGSHKQIKCLCENFFLFHILKFQKINLYKAYIKHIHHLTHFVTLLFIDNHTTLQNGLWLPPESHFLDTFYQYSLMFFEGTGTLLWPNHIQIFLMLD